MWMWPVVVPNFERQWRLGMENRCFGILMPIIQYFNLGKVDSYLISISTDGHPSGISAYHPT